MAGRCYTQGEGGGGRGQKTVCVPKIDLQVRAPLINFIFFRRENFLMWGGVDQNPGGGGFHPPPPESLSKGLVGACPRTPQPPG